MITLRAQVGSFDATTLDNPARIQFDALHVWSTRVEITILIMGLIAIYATLTKISAR
jgi:hypothetical protein